MNRRSYHAWGCKVFLLNTIIVHNAQNDIFFRFIFPPIFPSVKYFYLTLKNGIPWIKLTHSPLFLFYGSLYLLETFLFPFWFFPLFSSSPIPGGFFPPFPLSPRPFFPP